MNPLPPPPHAQYQPPLSLATEEPIVIPKQEIRMKRPQSLNLEGSLPVRTRVASAPGHIPTPIPGARIVINQQRKPLASSESEEKGEDEPKYCAFGGTPNAQALILLDPNKHRVVFRKNDVDNEDWP